ncbi:MAG: peptidyl-prolyl cis-trans isomerase [Candidatus Caldarchaeum sp.]
MKRLLPLMLILALATSYGCKRQEKMDETKNSAPQATVPAKQEGEATSNGKKVVARINGKPIYQEDLDRYSVSEYINDLILYEEGVRRGIDKELEKQVEHYKKRLVINRLKSEIMEKVPNQEVTDKEIEDYYNKNKDRYVYLSVEEITTSDKAIAEEIHKRAVAGEELRDIAEKYKKEGTPVRYANIRLTTKFNMFFPKKEKGAVTGVINVKDKYTMLKITDVRELPLDRVKSSIASTIIAGRRFSALNDFIEKLKKEQNIKIEILEQQQEQPQEETTHEAQ